MTREWLLDTNIAIAFLEGHDRVRRRFSTRSPDLLPYITVAELLFGAEKSTRIATRTRVAEFVSSFRVLSPTETTCRQYAVTLARMEAEKSGRIPSNDLWLACLALEREAVLVTDDHHFDKVPGLRKENWLRS